MWKQNIFKFDVLWILATETGYTTAQCPDATSSFLFFYLVRHE